MLNSSRILNKILRSSSTKNVLTRAFNEIKVVEENGVKNVCLSNEKTRNALSFSMINELKESVLNVNANVRCIVLKSTGKVFSSGHNLKELKKRTGKDFHTDIFKACSELMIGISKLEVPVIAQVNGIAAAAGCQLVCSCDIVAATQSSVFLTPGANYGIFCSTPGIPLVRNIPLKVAADMLLTGLPITAEQAYNAGLVSAVAKNEDELESEVQKRIVAIKSKSRSVVALGKNFLYQQKELSLLDAYRLGGKIMVENLWMKDGQEGIESFIEKRSPIWQHDE